MRGRPRGLARVLVAAGALGALPASGALSPAPGGARPLAASHAITASRRPVNLSRPQLLGIARVGLALTATHGSWSGTPTSYAYRLRRCHVCSPSCATIRGPHSP